MKQLDKDLSKIFFNSVEEMNECYGIDAELPSKLYSNANLVCYESVNEYLRKHLEKTLIGCEFIYCSNKAETPFRRFVHSVEFRKSGIVVIDQYGLTWYLSEQLLYPDDYSDPIHYKEWVKQINKQDVEVED